MYILFFFGRAWIKEAKYKPSTTVVNIAKKLKDEKMGNRYIVNTGDISELSSYEKDNMKEDDPLV